MRRAAGPVALGRWENGRATAVFTGDTLFVGDVGRPDLSPNHTPQELAGFLYDSSLSAMDEPYELMSNNEATGIVELAIDWTLTETPYLGRCGTMPSPSQPFQLYRLDYRNTNDSHFDVNFPQVSGGLDAIIQQSADAGLAAGKADVVTHSMGGVISRLYVQSPDYQHEVRRIVEPAVNRLDLN